MHIQPVLGVTTRHHLLENLTSNMESITSTCSTEADKMDLEIKDNEVFKKVIFEPIRIGPVSTLDEMDCKVLQFQNKKLEMKLEEYQRIENEFQQRIEQLEKRQSQDTIVLNIVNRYWNHLNDDIKTMLLEFDDECQNMADEIENDAALTFIKTLASSNESQIDGKLINNVEMSTAALKKILQTYDHILYKNDKIVKALKSLHENSKGTCDAAEEHERLFRYDGKFGNQTGVKKATKHSSTGGDNITNHTDTLDELYKSTDALANSGVPHGTNGAEIENADVASQQNTSSTKQPTTKIDKNAQLSATKTINYVFSPSLGSTQMGDDTKNSNDCDDDAKIGPKIDDSIRTVVAEIVERVASKFEFDESEFDECIGPDSKKKRDMGDATFEDKHEVADGHKLENGEDGTKFHEKLSAVKMTNDRMKEKSKVCVAVLKELKNVCTEVFGDNERLQNIIVLFQEEHQKSIVNEQNITEALKFKEHEYKQWKSHIDDIEYENERLKRRKTKIEYHLAEAGETLEKIKIRKRCREKSDSSSTVGKKGKNLYSGMQYYLVQQFKKLHREVNSTYLRVLHCQTILSECLEWPLIEDNSY